MENSTLMKIALSIYFFCLSFVVVSTCQVQYFPFESKHGSTNETLVIKVKTSNNQTVDLKSMLEDNKNYVVSIMATWCGPCKLELAQLQGVQEKWSKEFNTELLAISIDKPDDTAKVFEMFDKEGWTITVVHDDMAYTAKELKIFGIPQVFLVSKNKEITFSKKGFKSNLVSVLEKEILKLQ